MWWGHRKLHWNAAGGNVLTWQQRDDTGRPGGRKDPQEEEAGEQKEQEHPEATEQKMFFKLRSVSLKQDWTRRPEEMN